MSNFDISALISSDNNPNFLVSSFIDVLTRQIERFRGEEQCCRLLVGMQRPEEELLRNALARIDEGLMDNPRALALKKEIALSFRVP
ncbi:hypothetical protein [Syntrophomonas wolfei]|jgi:hypothetical protein|uniref:hypothetical protein n=1 Tax=Syntrophomonas wolfei TaxID=863 RepID=UPI0007735F99|nr:hypothetical protein [Syntrophomonas wolfei]